MLFRSLEVPLFELFVEADESNRVTVMRQGEHIEITTPATSITYTRLSKPRGQLEVLQGDIAPGGESSTEPRSHASEECIVVVSGDGIELFSAPVAAGDEPLPLDVDVADVDILTLSTREVGGNDHPAHVDWASARLVANPAASELGTPDAGH